MKEKKPNPIKEADLKIFEIYQKTAIKSAKDLCYGKAVIAKIEKATKASEIDRIMHDARTGKYKSENKTVTPGGRRFQ